MKNNYNKKANVTNDMRGEDSDDYGTFEIYKNGGNIEVKVVNSDKQYDEKQYDWILGDKDKDSVANADDVKPFDKNIKKRIDEPTITTGIKNLILLKKSLDSTMYSFIEDLKNVAPNKSKIYARTKTPYSVLDKLIKKRLSTITDLIGTTIVTNDKKELDAVKNYVESGKIGKVVEMEDMYEKPKQGYRAYHFLIERNGMTIELQVKTKRQKALNELSHEPYKLGKLNSPVNLKMTELANRADEGDKNAIKEYNDFMNQPNVEKLFYADGSMYAKGGRMSRSQKQYNKEVDDYKYFVVDLKNNKAVSGWEFKEDAKDSLSDYDGDKNFKVVGISMLKSMGIENPKESFKMMAKGGDVGDTIADRYARLTKTEGKRLDELSKKVRINEQTEAEDVEWDKLVHKYRGWDYANKMAMGGEVKDNILAGQVYLNTTNNSYIIIDKVEDSKEEFPSVYYHTYNQPKSYRNSNIDRISLFKHLIDSGAFVLQPNKMSKGGGVLSNEEIIKDIDFEDNTDRKHGRYDFSFTTYDKQGAEILDYDGYIIESPSSSRMNDEIEWGQNTPEDWESAEKILIDAFYEWKNKNNKMAKGGSIEDQNREMVLNENNQIIHHTKELPSAVKGKRVPAWVVTKVHESASDLSDATHYMDGQKMAKGGQMRESKDFVLKDKSTYQADGKWFATASKVYPKNRDKDAMSIKGEGYTKKEALDDLENNLSYYANGGGVGEKTNEELFTEIVKYLAKEHGWEREKAFTLVYSSEMDSEIRELLGEGKSTEEIARKLNNRYNSQYANGGSITNKNQTTMTQEYIDKFVRGANSTDATAREISTRKLKEAGLDKNGKPIESKKEVVKSKTSMKAKTSSKAPMNNDDYDCDEIIAEALKRKADAKKSAKKSANKPAVVKATNKVERTHDAIEKQIEQGKLKKAQIEKIIAETEDLLRMLKKALKSL
jgi:hypothetical protein